MITPKLQELLDALDRSSTVDFLRLLEALHAVQYTGPVTLHCLNGAPQQIDLGAPIRLSIVQALDKHRPSRSG